MLDDEIDIDLSGLDGVETGGEFTTGDYLVLGLLGVLVPAVLLVVGAL